MTKPYIRDNPRQFDRKYNPNSYMFAQMTILWEIAKLNNPDLPWHAFEAFLIKTIVEDFDELAIKQEFAKMMQKND